MNSRRISIEVEVWGFNDQLISERVKDIVDKVDGKRQHVVNVTCAGIRLRGADGYRIPQEGQKP